jgi:hypothetical protein
MKWDKKEINKPIKKGNVVLGIRSLSMVKTFQSKMLLKNIRTGVFGPVDYQARKMTRSAILDAECKKAEALTLIRRAVI